jgi:phage FluMu protein Com
LSGETVRNVLLEKKAVQQKSAHEPLVITCPRCGSPNQLDASLCIKCKSVLKREQAISISAVQKKLEEMQAQINMMMQGLVERDKEYFEKKYPRLRTMDKTTSR